MPLRPVARRRASPAVDPTLSAAGLVAHREQQNRGVQGARLTPLGLFLNPLGLFLRTSIPFIWRILSVFLPA
jgi:hypothetical protein